MKNNNVTVLVSADAQLLKTPDGKVWAKTIYSYFFWKRYLEVFKSIYVISRIMDVDYPDVEGYLLSSGENVEFIGLPMAKGAKEYFSKINEFIRTSFEAVKKCDCAIIRTPSISGIFVENAVRKAKIPYVVEVVVDPKHAYADKSFLAEKFITRRLCSSVLHANGASYVTRYALENIYPCYAMLHGEDNQHFQSYYSSIDLHESYFGKPKVYKKNNAIKIVHTANNVNNYVKGHKTVIEVVSLLRKRNIDASATFIGDGIKRKEFMSYAKELEIEDYVTFTGMLSSGDEVRKVLINSDLFLFPSKSEGLPRAVIEAMAVGLPCLSTPVDGIPELIDNKYLFDPEDVESFAGEVCRLLNSPDEMTEMSLKNITVAHEYEATILQNRRNEFYMKLLNLVKLTTNA